MWLGLPMKEKLQMLVCEQIPEEAEIMTMLILEEIGFSGKGQHNISKLDKELERGFDSIIYEKYVKIAEKQALHFT